MILSVLAALALPVPVSAPMSVPATLPQYERGDAFVFSDGRVERVVSVAGERVTWAGLSGPSYQRHRNFIVPILSWRTGRGSGSREMRGNPDVLWPLDRPRSARFRSVTETRANPQAAPKRSVSLWVCKSRKKQPLTVAAGTFEAVPVSCDRYSSTTMRLIERREWDYAPELNHYIRRSSVNYLRGTRASVELVATLSGPAATKARLTALARSARAKAR